MSKSGPRLSVFSVFITFDLRMYIVPQPCAVRDPHSLTRLTSKCASRHNGLHFFNISTSRKAPKLTCFVHFDFGMCFAPEPRAIFHLSSSQMAPNLQCFQHLHFQKCFAPKRCAPFSTSELPKVVRTWCAVSMSRF